MDASPPLSIPRLRLPRYSPQYKDQALTPIAGPSHNPDFLRTDDDGDDDAESTPRMVASVISDKQSPRTITSPGLPADNPTARLRALLARIPHSPDGATPHASSSRQFALPSTSEPESDFEPPQAFATTSSMARESLKELFSHALRDPGNTPRKIGRPRRNSIDASEVEMSMSVEEERAKYKGKRLSLSDEEAEKSKRTEPSMRSARSSAASTFDALRQRLNQSGSPMLPLSQDQIVLDMSMPPPNSSTDTAMPAGVPVDHSSETPPRATSTPARTFQMSANLNMHSNLLDQDSEMQYALQGMDSYESGPIPKHRHSTPSLKDSAGPTPRPQSRGSSAGRPLSWNSHSKSHSAHNLPQPPTPRRGSEDFDISSSRASSSMSSVDYKERGPETERERIHDRERGWNSPASKLPKSPARPGKHDLTHRHSWGSPNGHTSPGHRLTRKGSAASLTSVSTTDDAGASRPSSRASSVASRADYKDRMKTLEQEHNKEREREWNRPHPKLSRSSSSLDLNKSERVRTISTPSRPDSAASYLPLMTHTRHGSSDSLSSSRPGSPAGSVSAHDVGEEIEHEVEHQRERNWNSPRPDWSNSLHPHRRPLSPLPRSRPGSPVNVSPPKSAAMPRSRSNSTTHGTGLSVPPPAPRSRSPVGDQRPRPRSPMPHASTEKLALSHARPKLPVPSPEKNADPQSGFRSRFGWSFPQHKVELPPLELDQDSPQKIPPRPSSRASLATAASTPSHIPVRSPRKSGHDSTLSTADLSDKKRSHRRSVTEFTEAIGALLPRIEVSSDSPSDDLPPVPIVDSNDDLSYASEDEPQVATSTSTAKPMSLSLPEITTTPAIEPPAYLLNGYTPPARNVQARPESPLVSPPLTPPDADFQPTFDLQTPPRRPQSRTPKQEFETPPPPRGMPDLPGPPSSEDEHEEDHTPLMESQVGRGDLTAMKTPRPPGAWLLMPAPSRQFIKEPDEPERPDSTPPEANSSNDSGLATPPSTLSRTATLPLQTPAPPGGWTATPAGPAPATAPRRRGSLLKVRFDLESETASEGAVERPSGDESSESRALEGGPHSADVSGKVLNVEGGSGDDASALSASSTLPEPSVEPPPTPPSLRDRIRKKSPSIRVLDAYGREQVETAQAQDARSEGRRESAAVRVDDPSADHRQPRPSSPPTPRRHGRTSSSSTPRSKSGVRVVDAMGRGIEEDESLPLVDDESILSTTPLSHNEALSRMRSTLSSMKQELSDADRSSDKTVFDQHTYAALQEQCRTAQAARSKLSKSLQVAQTAEGESKSRHANHTPFHGKIGNGTATLLPIGDADASLTRNIFTWRFLACFVIVQLLLLAIMYRYALVQARKVFFTTYYDSFNPDLYLYLLKPDTTNHSIPPCPSWSIFSIFNGFQRAGWKGAIADAWLSTSCAFSSYLQPMWVGWHYTQDTAKHPWPPT